MEQLFYLPATMLWPLAACLVLTGIHVYLGVHVIARKVIFVDLALAQIAALGTVVGVLLGYEVGKDVNALYLYSLAFTIFGAFIFSVTRMRGEKVPHEAIIGIVYAVTFASTILVLSKSALGPQELDHIIKGELLWVQSHVVLKTAIIYACVGVFHFIFRKKFMAISFDPEAAEASGINVRFWDFLFYMSFGFVITSSVAIAGVFLVFSYLVIPSVGAMLLSDRLSVRLTIGWIAGSIISFAGVKISYNSGLPTSPAIVVVLAAGLLISGFCHYLKNSPSKLVALRNIGLAVLVVGVFVAGVFLFRKPEEDPFEHTLHLLSSPLSTDRQAGLLNLEAFADRKSEWIGPVIQKLKDQDVQVRKASVQLIARVRERSALPLILDRLDDHSDEVRLAAIQAIRALGDSAAAARAVATAAQEQDPEMKINLLKAALELGNPNAIPSLIQVIKEGGVFAEDAYDALRGHVPLEFTKEEYAKVDRWWREHRDKLRWDEKTRIFSAGG
jgi:zinc/manganese transport system permease protein